MPQDTPAPNAEELHDALEAIPDGPNIEADPDALKAAKGEIPLDGPRAEAAPSPDPAAA